MSELGMSDATAHPLARYRNHLEFLGYRVEEGEDELVGRHTRKPNLMLRPSPIAVFWSAPSTASMLT
jgi:hypothetical protein